MALPSIPYSTFSLRTKQLTIRPFQLSDYKEWVASNELRLPSQNRFDPGQRPAQAMTRERFRSLITARKATWKSDRFYGMGLFETKTGALVGTINVIPHTRIILQTSAIGYVIHNHHWRKGFAFEAVSAVTKFAFKDLGFNRLTAEIDVHNYASQKLSKKLGFRKEARAKNLVFDNGRWHDSFIYATTVTEWGLPAKPPRFRATSAEA